MKSNKFPKRIIAIRIGIFLMALLLYVTSYAQSGLNFQGVARNSNNVILASQQISLRLSILQGSATGNPEYTETRKVTTNAQGLFTAVIGDTGAVSTLGNFATINWQNTPKFLKIEMDPLAGTNFVTMGATQFQYVAYAQFANSVAAENIEGIVPVARGGTGTNSLSSLKTALALDKASVGLTNVDNTSDASKPISTATQTALDLKANVALTVPYTGATGPVNLGAYDLQVNGLVVGKGGGGSRYSTVLGLDALTNNTTGQANTAVGYRTLKSNAIGESNTAVGYSAMYTNTAGNFNTALGFNTLLLNETGYSNTAAGSGALATNTTGSANAAFGAGSLASNTTAKNNTAVGVNASNVNATSENNTAVGANSLTLSTGEKNSAVGSRALDNNSTGAGNTAIGYLALTENVSGNNNTAIGSNTHTSAAFNNSTAIGHGATINASNTIVLGNNNVTDVITSGAMTASSFNGNWNGAVIPLEKGGTGVTSMAGLKSALAIDLLNNTADASKPISIATQTALDLKAPLNNPIFSSDISVNGLVLGRGTANLENTVFGKSALYSNTTGNNNTAIGASSLQSNTTGYENVSIGYAAMPLNTSGTWNVALGGAALRKLQTGTSNVAIGGTTLLELGEGSRNVSVGYGALHSISTGNFNTAIGFNAAGTVTGGEYNTALGAEANIASDAITNSVAIGYNAVANASNTIQLGNANITNVITSGNISATSFNGTWNGTPIDIAHGGTGATTKNFVDLTTNQTIAGAKNFNSDLLINGIRLGRGNGTTASNILLGSYSLLQNTTGIDNVAMGNYVLNSNTTGNANVAIGSSALYKNTTGIRNVSIGLYSLMNNIDGTDNIGIGSSALSANTAGQNNIGIGGNALRSSTTAIRNISIGLNSMLNNTTGNDNIAIGNEALEANTISNYNIAVGYTSLRSNTIGQNNAAIGKSTLYSNTTGNNNAAFGASALMSNIVGSNNTTFGYQSLRNSKGNNNTSVGANALYLNSTGNYNTAIGESAGARNEDGSNNIFIGNLADASSASFTNAIAIGNEAIVDASNTIQLGNNNITKVVTKGTITADAVTYPNSLGTSGQFLTSNSSGVLTWTTQANSDWNAVSGASQILNKPILFSPNTDNVTLGSSSGSRNQGTKSVAVGYYAGFDTQGTDAISVGNFAGNTYQGNNAVAIGKYAGIQNQAINAISIGNSAGYTNQGVNSIAIGTNAGNSNQASNSIILNASGSNLDASTTGFFVAPVRSATTFDNLYYNTATKEITYGSGGTVTADAGNLTGSTLRSTVTSSSLTSVGTLANLTVTNPIVGSLAGNATSATTATTAENVTATSNTTLTSLSNLAAVGTITSGVWSGTGISVNKGGTGATTLPANSLLVGNGTNAIQSISPSTSGNILYANGTNWLSKTLSVGITGSNWPISVRDPSLVLNYCIATQGVWPTRSAAEPFLGEIAIFAFGFVPTGWMQCDGSLIPISQNTALFSLLGTTFGGNGQTTFALPDLRGKIPIGQGQFGLETKIMGEQIGSESIYLLSNQMPAHTHTIIYQ